MSRHLAIFTQMGNGHVYPILPLCSALTARGYRVTCPVSERYSRSVQATGAEAVLFTETPVGDALKAEIGQRAETPMNGSDRFDTTELEWTYLVSSTQDLLSQVSGFYDRNVPDLVLYNRYCLGGFIAARRLQRPAVQLSPHFAYPGRSRFWDHRAPSNPAGVAAYAERLDGLLATYGITGSGNLWHVEPLNIHLIPKAFQYQSDLFDERFVFTGSLLDRPFRPAWRVASHGRPIVLISGYSGLPETRSSDARYFRVFVDALAHSAYHCILSIGPDFPVHSLDPLPSNFEVNQYASHLEILPHAALLACHAGMGSTLEALYHGVPVLAVPGTPYTEEVGYRVAELCLGTLLPRSALSADSVREAVGEMLGDRALLARVKEMQHVFRRSAGAAAAADRIARYLKEQ